MAAHKWPTHVDLERPVLPRMIVGYSPNQSRRLTSVHLVVMHATEGNYHGAVSWLENKNAEASAHIVLREDGLEATQLVAWDRKAWACVSFNSVSDNIECAGFHDRESAQQLAVAARICAFRLHMRHLPCHWSRHGLEPGFTRHGDLGIAGGNHLGCFMTDEHFAQRFVPLVEREYKRGDFLARWGSGD